MKRYPKKIGTVTCVILLIISGFVTLIKTLLLIFIAGVFVNPLIAVVFNFPLWLWLFITGRMSGKVASSSLIGFLIGLVGLPDEIATVAAIIIYNNLQEIMDITVKVIPIAKEIQKVDAVTGGTISKGLSKATGEDINLQSDKVKKGIAALENAANDPNTPGALRRTVDSRGKPIVQPEDTQPLRGFNTKKIEQPGDQAQKFTNGVANDVLVLKKKQDFNENTLDLQNRMQETANRGVNTKQDGTTNTTFNTPGTFRIGTADKTIEYLQKMTMTSVSMKKQLLLNMDPIQRDMLYRNPELAIEDRNLIRDIRNIQNPVQKTT